MGEYAIEALQVRKRAMAYLHDFQQVQGRKIQQPLTSERAIRWIPPIYPLYKVNFDGGHIQ